MPLLRLAALLLALLLPLSAAHALTDEEENDAIVYAWDNAVFTLYHEIGHMFVDLYELPVLAKEEDAVDNLATLMALVDYNNNDDPILIDAAAGWIAALKGDDYSAMGASDFFDEHSVNAQRAYAMICVLVGSDHDKFTEIATSFGLDADRQERCQGDYEQTKTAWGRVMKPHRKRNRGEPRITVVYDENGEATQDGADILRDNEVLETVAKTVEGMYTLPRPITFKGADCGEDNAYYSSGDSTVTLCYELVQNYYDAYKKGLAEGNPPSVEGGAEVGDDSGETSDEAGDEGEEAADAGASSGVDASDPSTWFGGGDGKLGDSDEN